MTKALPETGPHPKECAIVNIDDSSGSGTHWVAYRENGKDIYHFDSFGNLRPPINPLTILKLIERNTIVRDTKILTLSIVDIYV